MGNPYDGLTADVAALVGDAQQRKEDRSKPVAVRRQSKRDRKRNKVTVDMPAWLEAEVRQIAERENAGVGTVVCWLIQQGAAAYRSGAEPRKKLARSLKYSYDLIVEE